MPPTDRQDKTLRLTQEQNRRLARAADSQGQTQQAFLLSAVMRAIEDTETHREQTRHRRAGRDRSYQSNEPLGLGLFRDKAKESPPPADTTQSQVVVNLGQQGPGQDDLLNRLVEYIGKGPDYNRDERSQMALDTVRRLSRNDLERDEMTRKLRDAVTTKARPNRGSFWDVFKDMI